MAIETYTEYTLENVAKTLLDKPTEIESTDFNISIFYLPLQDLQDPQDPPQQGKYGGDSFFIKELNNKYQIFCIQNGVGHGGHGRIAVTKANEILETIIKKNSNEIYLKPEMIVKELNQEIIKHSQNPAMTSSLAICFSTYDKPNLTYISRGDSAIYLVNNKGIIKNNPESQGFILHLLVLR